MNYGAGCRIVCCALSQRVIVLTHTLYTPDDQNVTHFRLVGPRRMRTSDARSMYGYKHGLYDDNLSALSLSLDFFVYCKMVVSERFTAGVCVV